MRHRLRQRLWARDGDPGPVAWAIASISLVLPLVGIGLCLVGGAQVMRGEAAGWFVVGLGAALIVLDVAIDLVWSHPSVLESDQPHLNRPADQLAGRLGIVSEAIEGGRGKIRVGGTVWVAEGPDLPAGATARVRSAKATVLVVEETSTRSEGTAADARPRPGAHENRPQRSQDR